MTMEFARPSRRRSHIPAEPGKPYFIEKGMGDRAHLFTDLVTVYAGGEQTENAFNFFTVEGPRGEVIPAHVHSDTYEVFYITDGAVRLFVEDLGVSSTRGCSPRATSDSYRRTARTPIASSAITAGSWAWPPGPVAPSSGSSKISASPPRSSACRPSRTCPHRRSSRPCRSATTCASCPSTSGAPGTDRPPGPVGRPLRGRTSPRRAADPAAGSSTRLSGRGFDTGRSTVRDPDPDARRCSIGSPEAPEALSRTGESGESGE